MSGGWKGVDERWFRIGNRWIDLKISVEENAWNVGMLRIRSNVQGISGGLLEVSGE